ncbi:hypothetical protein ACTWQF_08085 [Streptomyces sp. 8N114]|uniref:hypothetical protein n=1 Tax=Streptomyces sp. 8N114 TaxID=3457419 RepID=UPI003FD53EDA
MDIGYRAYLDILRMTRGAFSWQFLFTQAPLGSEEFSRVRGRVEGMLDQLPNLFPQHDYEPLRQRLAARV